MRVVSNLRAYAALGFRLRVLLFSSDPALDVDIPLSGDVSVDQIVVVPRNPSVSARICYRLGLPQPAAIEYMFPAGAGAFAAARRLERHYPHAIHHFEGEDVAAAMLFGSVPRSIWSFHDMPSAVSQASADIASELEGRGQSRSESREVRFMRSVERRLARRAHLILTISEVDCGAIRGWGLKNVEALPFSVEHEPGDIVRRSDSGRLKLLHLGRVAHLPSYRSLEFLLEQVVPRLDGNVRRHVELLVVGTATGSDMRTRRIQQLAAQHPDVVRLCGYVDDLAPLYQQCDAQVVAAAQATGARTRVVESFAHSLPVISTSVGAAGIRGLRPGRNILIANEPDEWTRLLSTLASERTELAAIGREGRLTYEREHSSNVVADSLAQALDRHFGSSLPVRQAR